MERVPLLYQGRSVGEVTAQREGEDTCFHAVCRLPEKGLWCLWAVGSEGELRLGVPEGGEEARLARRFSQRLTAPLGRLQRGELRLAVQPEEKPGWETAPRPETLFHTPWLRRALAGQQSAMICRREKQCRLALPFSPEKPFPLPGLFCFACIRTIGGREYAIFTFDAQEWPVMPQGL